MTTFVVLQDKNPVINSVRSSKEYASEQTMYINLDDPNILKIRLSSKELRDKYPDLFSSEKLEAILKSRKKNGLEERGIVSKRGAGWSWWESGLLAWCLEQEMRDYISVNGEREKYRTTAYMADHYPDLFTRDTLSYHAKKRDENGLTEQGIVFTGPGKSLMWDEVKTVKWRLGV